MEDLNTHHHLLSNKEVMYYLEDIATNTLEESKENLIQSIDAIKCKNREAFFFRIINKYNLQYIGEIGFHVVGFNGDGKHVHLGYFINKEYWGNGYTSEAVKAMIDFSFNQDISLITSGCLDEHVASKRVLEKNGFCISLYGEKEEYHRGIKKKRINYELFKE